MSDQPTDSIFAVSAPICIVCVVVAIVYSIAWGTTHVESEAIAAGYVQRVVVTSYMDGTPRTNVIWTKPSEPTTEQPLRVEATK